MHTFTRRLALLCLKGRKRVFIAAICGLSAVGGILVGWTWAITSKKQCDSPLIIFAWCAIASTAGMFALLVRKRPATSVEAQVQGIVNDLDRQPELRLRGILQGSPIGFLLIDNDFTILEFNSLMEDFVEVAWLKPLEKNENLVHFLTSQQMADFREHYQVVLQGDKINFTVDYPWEDGSSTSFEMTLHPVLNDRDMIVGCCMSSEDISTRVASGAKVSELNIALEKKVAERTLQYETVNKELEAFTFSVSHDLRAPLRAVNSYAQIMLQDYGEKLDQDGRDVLEKVRYNGQKMGRLIDELLAFSRIGRKEIDRQVVNMDELVGSVIADISQTHKIPETVSICPLPTVEADYTMLYQVMYNLLSNAIKYSSKKPRPVIEIYTQVTDHQTVFVVKDNGAGFDMRFADKLFGVFQRLHSEKEFEGNGVGLAIVHRIITKFGGRVWAEAKEKEGAAFYFTLSET